MKSNLISKWNHSISILSSTNWRFSFTDFERERHVTLEITSSTFGYQGGLARLLFRLRNSVANVGLQSIIRAFKKLPRGCRTAAALMWERFARMKPFRYCTLSTELIHHFWLHIKYCCHLVYMANVANNYVLVRVNIALTYIYVPAIRASITFSETFDLEFPRREMRAPSRLKCQFHRQSGSCWRWMHVLIHWLRVGSHQ